MIVDARRLASGFALEADLCIVGTGAAGLTLAKLLNHSRISICLLESGGFKAEPETQDLYRGEYAGNVPTLNDEYLVGSRLRYFGGTTNHWGGLCRPMEPSDFEIRDWVPNSGWPFTKSDLEPYYRRAAEFMQMRGFDRDNPDEGNAELPVSLDGDTFRSKVFRRQPRRFGTLYRGEIKNSSNIRLLHHANAVEIVSDESSPTVLHIAVATLTGVAGTVRARNFVLATGGIENCRLLLASDGRQRNGLGNQHDLVGRYFMEHAVTHFGMGPMLVWPEVSMAVYRLRDNYTRMQALYLNDDLVRRHRMLNVSLLLGQKPRRPIELSSFDTAMAHACFDVDHPAGQANDQAAQTVATVYMCEQEPNPESRVTLTSERDALGMRRVRLGWKLTGAEVDSIKKFADILGRTVAAMGYGRLKDATSPEGLHQVMSKGWHHMGTTRMHDDPKRGVVDRDCRVHGIDNLYVAGSSVYPTSGSSNPTFTIVALAIRLADHLKQRMRAA